jgi:hypothetical protein
MQLRSHYELEDLGGGRFHHVQHLKQANFEKNGLWRRIANKLEDTGDPNFPIGCDEVLPVRFDPRTAGASPFMHLGTQSAFARFALVDGRNVTGVYRDNVMTYAGAWPNTVLRYALGGHLHRENIDLLTGHPRSFGFRLQEHAGFDPLTLCFGDAFRLLEPTLEPPAGSLLLAIPLKWVVTSQGGKWILTVNLPNDGKNYAGWTIDPSPLVLQPGAADGMDTIITSSIPTTNYGALTVLAIGDSFAEASIRRTLIKFNLATLPETAVISSATLSLYVTVDQATSAGTFTVHRQKRAWVEGQATWNIYSMGNNWSTAGGFHADDCEQSAIGTLNFTATETLNQWKNWALTPTTKAALDLGTGWLMKTTAESNDEYQFPSSDYTTDITKRPQLSVTYTLPAGVRAFTVPFIAPFQGVFG